MKSPALETIFVDGVNRPITNSIGSTLAADHDGIVQFWQWFGNSPIVDMWGQPLVTFHGTRTEFYDFKESQEGNIGPGIYMTSKPDVASSYSGGWDDINECETFDGSHVLMLYTNMRNPIIAANEDDLQNTLQEILPHTDDWREIKSRLIELGHDGIWVQDKLSDEIVSYDSTNIRCVFKIICQLCAVKIFPMTIN